jgi:penicillin-binding protein 2
MKHKNEINLEDILSDKLVENSFLEIPLNDKVFKVFFGIVILIFLVIFFQLINISVFHHQVYERSAFGNITESDIEPAPRGVIKDRFGNVIVDNKASFHVFLSPRSFPKSSEERKEVLNKISGILDIDLQELSEDIENYDWRLGNFLLEKNISHEELITLSSEDVPGIKIESGFTRIASSSKVFSHLVGIVGLATKEDIKKNPGFVLKNEIGKSGLELLYDENLRGQSGKEIAYINAHMEIEDKKVVSGAKMGQNLDLFIDAGLQEYFYDRLSRQIKNVGGKGGVGVVVNPQNGEVLSLISIPGFEIGSPVDYLDQPNQPFFNRVVSGLYNPGSTIKPLHAIAALEEGIVNPEKSFLSTGRLVVSNPYNPNNPSVFKDWKAHGWVNLYSALARSSNVYFYTIGGGFEDQEGLGISRLNEWWKKFRLDKKTEIDLPGEDSGSLPNVKEKEEKYGEPWRVGDTYNVSIGQGNLMITPLELINYISAVANGGKIYKLRIAKNQKEEILKDISKEIESALPHVRKGMKDAADKPYGTAYHLSNLPFDVAAKTGSSQVGNEETNALFVGFAPYENPEIALIVLIENSEEGGLNAVPVANDVFSWYYFNRMAKTED